jgi:hypothetical protein
MTFTAVKASNTRRISEFRATVRSSLCIFYFSGSCNLNDVDDVFEKPMYMFSKLDEKHACLLI